ncbi:hypothetical protein C1645_816927 [Glomus cerebriforme]|uniref:Uncharacterized protein n=1 Tax=Glomus cerebriforme TaxID=658196 RepID=A0A397TAL2_9GLOM|nr:hypothetical protein C1645_816927 [Glomus cerebriforme]
MTKDIFNKDTQSSSVSLSFGSDSLYIIPVVKLQSVRILSIWVNLDFNCFFVKIQINDDIIHAVNVMKYKKLTDKHLVYIFNTVLYPKIEYRSQLMVLSKNECLAVTAPFRKLFNRKIHLSSSFPSSILHSSYEIKNTIKGGLLSLHSVFKEEFFKPYVYTRFRKLKELVLLSPGISRRIHYNWFPSLNLSQESVFVMRSAVLDKAKNWVQVLPDSSGISSCDISPSFSKPIVKPCPGCVLHNPDKTYSSAYRREHDISVFCSQVFHLQDLIKICCTPSKVGSAVSPMYDLKGSLFKIHTLMKCQFSSVNIVTDDSDGSFPVVIDNSLHDPFLKFILNTDMRKNLLWHKRQFAHTSSLNFYTDGSLIGADSTDMKMGITWKQVDSSFPYNSFNASLEYFSSSLCAEIAAVLVAICIVPVNCMVHIFMDSENVIYELARLSSYSNNFLFNSEKSKNYMLWIAIKTIMDAFHLRIITHKVKSYSDDLLNDKTNWLAKDGCTLPPFVLDSLFVASSIYLISWNNHVIDQPIRSFIKSNYDAQLFDEFINLHQNQKMLKLTRLNEISKILRCKKDIILSIAQFSQLRSLSCWDLVDSSSQFIFSNLIILLIIHNIQGSLYNDIWLVRCDLLVKKKLTFNIDNKVKRGGKYLVNPLNLVFSLTQFDNFSHYLHVANSWILWCDHSCYYGNN